MVNYIEPTREKKWQLWGNMKTRCYNQNYHKERPGYAACTICDEWLEDKRKFYEWVDRNFYVIDGEPTVELDKDILIKGNKLYSPETCIFVPKRINDLFCHINGHTENGLPTGVMYSEKTGKYIAKTCIDKKKKTLGFFETPEEAFAEYKKHKEAEIIHTADIYKDVIPEQLYKAMIAWDL